MTNLKENLAEVFRKKKVYLQKYTFVILESYLKGKYHARFFRFLSLQKSVPDEKGPTFSPPKTHSVFSDISTAKTKQSYFH